MGTWNLNVSKSTYEGIPPEQRRNPSTRTIDVHADGFFVETHRNKTGGGREGFYYWYGRPGGAEFVEYGRTGGDAPGNKLTIKVVNERQWAVTFRNQQNQIVLSDTWTVSPDNKTLTIDRHGISSGRQRDQPCGRGVRQRRLGDAAAAEPVVSPSALSPSIWIDCRIDADFLA